jgi:hypothetical protein
MRNRTWSDVVMALTIAACVAAVAEPQQSRIRTDSVAGSQPDVAEAARSLAASVLFERGDNRHAVEVDRDVESPATPSATDRAVASAAQAAGHAARDIEMPFFSFGGDASAE